MVFFNGVDFSKDRVGALSKIGSIIESPRFYPHLTGIENLRYLDYIFKRGEKRIHDVLDLAGLPTVKHKKVKAYSSGMKQRLAIAMSILHDPDLLILDEPLNSLDPQGIFDIRELLKKLNSNGKTILISSHILSEIEKTCTHVGILEAGSLLYQGSMAELMTHMENSVLFQLDDLETAHILCQSNNIKSTIMPENKLLVKLGQEIVLSSVIELFTQSTIKIKGVEQPDNNLESVFLKLTTL